MAGALTLTACVLVLGLIVLRIYEALFQPHVESPDPYLEPFHGPSLPSSWAQLVAPFYDSRGQRLAHLAMTAGAAILFIFPSLTRAAGRVPERAGRGLVLLAALAVVGVAMAGAGWTELAIGAALGAGFAAGSRALRRRVVDRTCAVLAGVILLGATIPGWLKRLNLSAAVPAWVEWQRAVGAESGGPVVDLAAHLEKDSRLFDGFLTLSEAGAEEVALRVGEALLPRMKDRRGRT